VIPDAVAAGVYIGLLLGALHVAVRGTARRLLLRIALVILIVYLAAGAILALGFARALGQETAPAAALGFWSVALMAPWLTPVLDSDLVASFPYAGWLPPALNVGFLCALAAWLRLSGGAQARASFLDLTPTGRSLVYLVTVCLAAVSALSALLRYGFPGAWHGATSSSVINPSRLDEHVSTYVMNPYYEWVPRAIGLPLLVVVSLLLARRLWIATTGRDSWLPASYGGFSLLLCEAALVFWVVALLFVFSSRGSIAYASLAYTWVWFPAAFLPLVAFVVAELRSFGKRGGQS